jgi:TMEM175 potassium channel family protein
VERLAALSDGVFAIVVTLLVLEIRLPEPPHPGSHVLIDLGDNVPDFLGWLISFVVLARFWTIHHHVVSTMARVRTPTIVVNFVFLGLISLVPFEASLVGTYEFETPFPLAIFSLGLGLAALMLGLLARQAAREPQLLRTRDHDLERQWRHHVAVVPLVALAAAAAAFLHPAAAGAVWLSEALLALSLSRRASRARRSRLSPRHRPRSDAVEHAPEQKEASRVV